MSYKSQFARAADKISQVRQEMMCQPIEVFDKAGRRPTGTLQALVSGVRSRRQLADRGGFEIDRDATIRIRRGVWREAFGDRVPRVGMVVRVVECDVLVRFTEELHQALDPEFKFLVSEPKG